VLARNYHPTSVADVTKALVAEKEIMQLGYPL